jgi:hypothetical protein
LPLVLVLALVVRGSAAEQAPRSPGLLERVSRFFHSEPEKAPLDAPYKPVGKLKPINLAAQANKKLADGTPDRDANNLSSLPQGRQALCGVEFNIGDSQIQLSSVDRPEWPKEVKGIPVEAPLAKLYILHATQGGETGVKDGTTIARYVVRYADTTTEMIPVVYGEDVRDWWNNDRCQAVTRGRVAWVGENADAAQYGMTLRLFVTAWENPKPDVRIASIDYVSEVAGEAAPFCIAMTAEGSAETGAKTVGKPK